VLSVWIDLLRRRELGTKTLLGLPELSERAYPGRLLQDGIYRVIRHPRYLSVIVGTPAFALVANYLGAYLVLLICLLVLYPVIVLEERELVRRFGRDYEEYRSQVPAIIPRRPVAQRRPESCPSHGQSAPSGRFEGHPIRASHRAGPPDGAARGSDYFPGAGRGDRGRTRRP
jgi:hypothetical protein